MIVSVLLLSLGDYFTINYLPSVYHFDPVFFSYVQLANHKGLFMGNLVSQYGGYNYLIWLFFSSLIQSVKGYMAVMTALTAASIGFIVLFLHDYIKNNKISLVISGIYLSLIGKIFARVFTDSNFDPYYQYMPIRTVFAALMIYMVWKYISAPSPWRFYALGVISSVSIFWNFDTGLVCFASWLIFLAYQYLIIGRFNWIGLARAWAGTLGTALVCALLLVASYFWFYGQAPDLALTMEFQRVFALSGFYMLPAPLVGSWVLVVFIYLLTFALVSLRLIQQRATEKTHIIFYIAILGSGLFSYYVGRSHDMVLISPWYPAILLALLLISDLLCRVNPLPTYGQKALLLLVVAFGVLSYSKL